MATVNSRRVIELWYNMDERRLCDSNGATFLDEWGKAPYIYFTERVLIWLHLLDAIGDPYTGLEELTTYSATLTEDGDFQVAAPPCRTADENINIADDWDDADPATGKFSIRLDAFTEPFETWIATGTNGVLNAKFELQGFYPAVVQPSAIIQFKFWALDVSDYSAGDPDPLDPNYLTAAQIAALIAGKMDSVPTATVGNIGSFDAAGQMIDASIAADEIMHVSVAEGSEALADDDIVGGYNTSGTAVATWLVSRFFTYVWTKIVALATKATPVDADSLPIVDSADSNAGKRVTFAALWTWIQTQLGSEYNMPTAWENDDCDTGTEVLVQWLIDEACAYKVIGTIEKAAAQVAFEALIHLNKVDDGSGGFTYSVGLNVQQSLIAATDDDDLAWDNAGTLYSDYDEGTGYLRLRATFASDNWTAQGVYVRVR